MAVALVSICGKEFIPQHLNSKYCSDTCAHRAKVLKNAQRRRTKQLSRDPIPCAFCGKPFVPVNLHMKYCSKECSNLASKFYDKRYYLRTIDKRKAYRHKRYLAHKGEILAKQRAKRREDAAKQGRTVRPRKPNLKLSDNLIRSLANLKPIVVPTAVAQNREPTYDEILDFIFKEQSP